VSVPPLSVDGGNVVYENLGSSGDLTALDTGPCILAGGSGGARDSMLTTMLYPPSGRAHSVRFTPQANSPEPTIDH
jgi:hypothetical protein